MSEALEPGTSRATLDDMATAWWRVAITLDELDPGWSGGRLVNADAACATIRDLAGEKALREIEVSESLAERVAEELTAKLGRPLRMTDSPLLATACAKAFLSSTNQEQST